MKRIRKILDIYSGHKLSELNLSSLGLILSKFKEHYSRNPIWKNNFYVNVTNYCNLDCFSCSVLCDKPMGSNCFRDVPRNQDLSSLNKFLDLIKDFRIDHWIRLGGGEPTATGYTYLKELVNIVKCHNRKICLLSNGFKLSEFDPHLFDFIQLDNHGTNQKDIDNCIERFKSNKYGSYGVIIHKWHRDLEHQRKTNLVSWGLNCPAWLRQITLWQDVVYPCCNFPYFDGWDNDTIGTDSLKKTGWSVENPNLKETIEDWKNTIPNEVIRKCIFSCWNGKNEKIWVKI